MGAYPRRSAIARVLAVLGVVIAASSARADGWSAQADVLYSNSETALSGPLGPVSQLYASSVPQRYRLSLDKQFYPYLIASAFGQYEWSLSWSTLNGVDVDGDRQRWNVYASLIMGPPVLNATPFYSRRQESGTATTSGVTIRSPTLANQAYGLNLAWTPAGLPLLSARIGRTEDFDLSRSLLDRAANEVSLNVSYLEVQNLVLQFSGRWSALSDSITGVRSSDVALAGMASYSASFWQNRISTSIAYNSSWRFTEVQSGSSGTVRVQQFPLVGLSLVETFPSVPSQDSLAPNPALIDGNLTSSAGIDIGYAPVLSGDQNFRDMGVGFASTGTPVNRVWVWVDRPLPPLVAASYSFTAWQSQDNVVWTQLPLAGAVTFGAFDNRFEIPTAQTDARYVKVVVRPLAPGVTVDPTFANVFVTEVQVYLEVPADQVPRQSTQTSGNIAGSVRILFVPEWGFNYTGSVFASHGDDFVPDTWTVVNGLGVGRSIGRNTSFAARVERSDSGAPDSPHLATNRWSAQVAYTPIPTIGGTLSYSGQYSTLQGASLTTNGINASVSLTPLSTLALSGSGGYTWAHDGSGRDLSGWNATASVTLTPITVLSLNAGWSLTSSITQSLYAPITKVQQTSLQGSATFTPVSSLFFTAGIVRSMGSEQADQTLLNFSSGFTPFPGGQLVAQFFYTETLDTLGDNRLRNFGPSLRWNIRSGTYLDLAYTWNNSSQPTFLTQVKGFIAHLVVTLN